MRVMLLTLLVLAVAPARAQTLRIELLFEGESVRVGRVQRIDAPAPAYFGFAQAQPLYFEVLGAKGQVLYAEPLQDPRAVLVEGGKDGDEAGYRMLTAQVGRAFVHAPALGAARELRVCRRLSEGGKLRQVLGRGGL